MDLQGLHQRGFEDNSVLTVNAGKLTRASLSAAFTEQVSLS